MPRTFDYHYPGDPIARAAQMTALEFDRQTPDRGITITTEGSAEFFPVAEVICDLCNAECPPETLVVLTESRLYCATCAAEWILPYEIAPQEPS